jgi:hypothetical protein
VKLSYELSIKGMFLVTVIRALRAHNGIGGIGQPAQPRITGILIVYVYLIRYEYDIAFT